MDRQVSKCNRPVGTERGRGSHALFLTTGTGGGGGGVLSAAAATDNGKGIVEYSRKKSSFVSCRESGFIELFAAVQEPLLASHATRHLLEN